VTRLDVGAASGRGGVYVVAPLNWLL
jgi:hypothetical protein